MRIGSFALADGEYRPYTSALEEYGMGVRAPDHGSWRIRSRMPIYVYERPDGSRFELRQGFNDFALMEDPETGVAVRRIMQPAPIIFKGAGWYKTDSRAPAPSASGTDAKATDAAPAAEKSAGDKGDKAEAPTTKEAVSDATAKTTSEIKKAVDKPATPAAAS